VTVYVEDWQAAYGAPYLVRPEDQGAEQVELVEDGGRVESHRPEVEPAFPIVFVDGVRRGEAALYQHDAKTGTVARGVAGSHACGAVIATENSIEFADMLVQRLVIWGSGITGSLPDVPGGWSWDSKSIGSTEPDAPLMELQERMRRAEGMLAERMADTHGLTVADGPLHYVRSRDLANPAAGYIKTHHRMLLPPEEHTRIPGLGAGERTSLFRLRNARYSCYLRLVPASGLSGPWAGIVRLEVPQSAGLKAAVELCDRLTATLPRFAGIPHRDPRAPQNLQPIGALESHLRHLLGHPGLAFRAVRQAVSNGLTPQGVH
jgi:hypothetical protein